MGEGIILNTRPAYFRARVHDAFAGIGWPIVDCPVLSPEPVGVMIPASGAFDVVIFTSQLAVNLFPLSDGWRSKKVYAVGPGTAEAARAAGFTDVIRTGATTDELRRYLATASFGAALYPSGEEITADLALDMPGRIHRIVIYRMVPCGGLPAEIVAQAKSGKPILAPLFSQRSAIVLSDLFDKAGITAANAQMTAIAMSDEIITAGAGPWRKRVVAAQPTLEAMAGKVRELAAAQGATP